MINHIHHSNEKLESELNYLNSKIDKSRGFLNFFRRRFKNADKLHADALNRLQLHHSILSVLEKHEKRYNSQKPGRADGDLYYYRLSVTDLFVEKAIIYLEERSNKYFFWAILIYFTGFFIACSGLLFLIDQMAGNGIYCSVLLNKIFDINFCSSNKGLYGIRDFFSFVREYLINKSWMTLVTNVIKSAFFCSILIFCIVKIWSFGKALIDQSERLNERAHALRQGRLFVHLSNKNISIDDLEKAFEWNLQKGNAFGDIPSESGASLLKVLPDLIKELTALVNSIKIKKE